MAFLDDTLLIIKKIAVTVVIYLVPVTILVGGLLLTKHLLGGDTAHAPTVSTSSSTNSR